MKILPSLYPTKHHTTKSPLKKGNTGPVTFKENVAISIYTKKNLLSIGEEKWEYTRKIQCNVLDANTISTVIRVDVDFLI